MCNGAEFRYHGITGQTVDIIVLIADVIDQTVGIMGIIWGQKVVDCMSHETAGIGRLGHTWEEYWDRLSVSFVKDSGYYSVDYCE